MGQSINFLNIISAFSKNGFGYVINFDTEQFRIKAITGPIEHSDPHLAEFNKLLAQDKTAPVINLKKTTAYKKLAAEYSIKSAFISDFGPGSKIVLFSAEKGAFGKSTSDIIEKLISAFREAPSRFGFTEDIEEKSIRELEKSEEKFRMLVDTANDLIFILNGFGYFSMVNKNGALALGYTPADMIGKHFLEYIEPGDAGKIAEAFQKIINAEDVTIFEANFVTKLNSRLTFEIHSRPLKTDGEITGMISIGRDISSRLKDSVRLKELNQKLIEANRIISIERERAKNKITVLEELNKLKGEFISNVSHELRTPLASIVGFAETILSDREIPKEAILDFTGIILTEGKRLAKLINEVLDFSKLDSGEDELKYVTFNIADLLDEVRLSFQKQIQEKEIIFSADYPPQGVNMRGDKERLVKAMSNLFSNAVKFSGRGGRITVIVQDIENELEISISDTGIGIAPKDIPNLFQKFSKINRPGSQVPGAGFGLVTVKQVIDLHKGIIKVTSELNKGTTVIIRLPK